MASGAERTGRALRRVRPGCSLTNIKTRPARPAMPRVGDRVPPPHARSAPRWGGALILAAGSPDGCPAVGLTDGTGPSRVTEAGIRRGTMFWYMMAAVAAI